MNKRIVAKIVFCFSVICCGYYESEGWAKIYPPFRKASSEAEKKLEYVLQWTCMDIDTKDEEDGWTKILNYITEWPHTKPEMPLRYDNLFTKEFIYSWSKEEKEEVDMSCDGKYNDGICGMEFCVLHCGQDCDEEYFYRTIEETDDYAIIQYTWTYPKIEEMIKNNQPLYTAAYGTYKLVKRNDVWVIDGLMCEENRFSLNFGRSKD